MALTQIPGMGLNHIQAILDMLGMGDSGGESLAGDYTDTSTMDSSGSYSRQPLNDPDVVMEDITGVYDDPQPHESSGHYGGYGAPGDSSYEGYDDYWNPLSSHYGDADYAAYMYPGSPDDYLSGGGGSGGGGGVTYGSGGGSATGGVGVATGGVGVATGGGGLPSGGGMYPPSGMNWWRTNWQRTPTMQNTLDNWLLGSYLNGPSALADQVTREFDSQLNMNADRSHQRGMLNDILSAVNGMNTSGPRMQGFQDTRTGQGARLPGATNIGTSTNSITAGPLPQGRIDQAAQVAQGGGNYSAPNAGLRIPAAAQAELDGRYANSMQVSGERNANELSRWGGAANARLGRAADIAASGQGIDNASWLVGQDASNARNDMMRKNALLRMAGRVGGLG